MDLLDCAPASPFHPAAVPSGSGKVVDVVVVAVAGIESVVAVLDETEDEDDSLSADVRRGRCEVDWGKANRIHCSQQAELE